MKDWIFNTIFIVVLILLGGSMIYFIVSEYNKNQKECNELGIYDECSSNSKNCNLDCKKLGKEYFKTVSKSWGRYSCICLVGNNTEVIW